MHSITKYDPLISCTTYKKDTYVRKMDIKTFMIIPESDFIDFEWWIVLRKNQIESVKNASSAQYFEYNVLPKLSPEYKKYYNELNGKCPEDIEHDVLLWVLKARYERDRYENEVNKPMTPEEKEQRKQSINLIKRTLNF